MKILTHAAIAATAIAVALAPAATAKGGPPESPGHGGNQPTQHGKGHQKPKKPKKVVAKGKVVSYDATAGTLVVHVTKANHHGAGMVGTDVSFDVSKAKFVGADTNNDGKVDATDAAVGDKVVVKTTNVAGSDGRYSAKQVVDQTHPAESDSSDSQDGQTAQS